MIKLVTHGGNAGLQACQVAVQLVFQAFSGSAFAQQFCLQVRQQKVKSVSLFVASDVYIAHERCKLFAHQFHSCRGKLLQS